MNPLGPPEPPSSLLGRAADKLAGLAATATPGPWHWIPEKHHRQPGTAYFSEAVFVGELGRAAVCVATTGQSDDPPSMRDAAWIAIMSPAVASPVIEWLRYAQWAYSTLEQQMRPGASMDHLVDPPTLAALAFARAVLGVPVPGEDE